MWKVISPPSNWIDSLIQFIVLAVGLFGFILILFEAFENKPSCGKNDGRNDHFPNKHIDFKRLNRNGTGIFHGLQNKYKRDCEVA